MAPVLFAARHLPAVRAAGRPGGRRPGCWAAPPGSPAARQVELAADSARRLADLTRLMRAVAGQPFGPAGGWGCRPSVGR